MENKELQGVMFPHEKQNEKQPDLRGYAKIGGVDYYVAAWKRTSKAGNGYLSLAFQVKEAKPKQTAPANTAQETVNQVSQAVGGPDEITDATSAEIDEVLPFRL